MDQPTEDYQLVGINFGKFLPRSVVDSLYHIYYRYSALAQRYDFSQLSDIDLNTFSYEFQDIEGEIISGGKDTYFLLKVKLGDHKFIIKFYYLNQSEVLMYLLSINEFATKIPGTFEIDNDILLSIRILDVYAFGVITGISDCVMVVQGFSEHISYVDFIKTHKLNFNLIKTIRSLIQDTGFVLDYHPNNFLINYNNDKRIYQAEYLDYFLFNDPSIRLTVKIIMQQITEKNLTHHDFILFKPPL